MSQPPLLLVPLRKVLASLDAALAQPKNEFIRDSVIQRFEYTYVLTWKLLKRHLEDDEGVENIDHLTRKELFRVAFEKGLIGDVEAWFAYHGARNATSHTYNEDIAEELYAAACAFAPDARRLFAQIERRIGA